MLGCEWQNKSVSKKIKQHQRIKITYDVKLNIISSIYQNQNFLRKYKKIKRANHISNIVIHLFSIYHRK